MSSTVESHQSTIQHEDPPGAHLPHWLVWKEGKAPYEGNIYLSPAPANDPKNICGGPYASHFRAHFALIVWKLRNNWQLTEYESDWLGDLLQNWVDAPIEVSLPLEGKNAHLVAQARCCQIWISDYLDKEGITYN